MSYMLFYLRKLLDPKPAIRKKTAKLLKSSRNPSALYRLKVILPREEDPSVQIVMKQAIEQLSQSLDRNG